MLKVTKAVIVKHRLTKPKFPHVIIFFLSEGDEVVQLEVNVVKTLDFNFKPVELTHVCTIYKISTGAGIRIGTKFEGEAYYSFYESTDFDNPGEYIIDNAAAIIKFQAGVMIGQDLANKVFTGKGMFDSQKGYDVLYKDLYTNFIKSRFTISYVANEFKVRKLYKLDRVYEPIIEDEV